MTATSIEIGSDLRRILLAARTNPERWGGGKLTQEEAAHGAGVSPVLYRNLENGYTPSTLIPTLVGICKFLGVDPDDLDSLGYGPVADGLRLRMKMEGTVIIDLRKLRGFTDDEKRALDILVAKYRTANGAA